MTQTHRRVAVQPTQQRKPLLPNGLRAIAGRVAAAGRSSDGGLLVLALIVGAGAGGGAIVFRWLISSFTRLFSGHDDYAGLGRVGNPHVPWLGVYFVLLAPVVAGLIYGPLVSRFAPEARGHGVPEVMVAVARRGGRIKPQVAAVKAIASALTIGGGGSVGREGPIVQIGSALGSSLGQLAKLSESRVRALVACGAAGGIAATFNAPLAGVFFAMELILRSFTARAFGMVVLSSVTASVVGRAALGDQPFLHLPAFHVDHVSEYGLFVVLGVIAAFVGVAFTRVLYLVEDGCDALWRGPEWLRPAVGGVVLGGILLALPEMYGVGYPVLSNGVTGRYDIAFLLVLLVGKMLATSVTIGIGGSGGVFAPSLFIGAMLGAAFGEVGHGLAPHLVTSPGPYALIGMGAVFAGAARAPITAVIIMFELTGEYTIILPLMAAIVLSTGVSHLMSRDTIYTLKLRRRGIDIDEHPHALALRSTTVRTVMTPVGPIVSAGAPLAAATDKLASSKSGQLPVLDADRRLVGILTERAMADAIASDSDPPQATDELVEPAEPVTTADTLDRVLDLLDRSDRGILPVTNSDGQLVGWISHREILRQLSESAESTL